MSYEQISGSTAATPIFSATKTENSDSSFEDQPESALSWEKSSPN